MLSGNAESARAGVSTFRRIASFVALLICLLIIGGILITGTQFFMVPSRSMIPTLLPGDHIIATKTDDYQRGDVVVFRNPDDKDDFQVKRIVGMPGDTVHVIGGAVYLDEHYASEPYRHRPIDYVMKPYVVPEGEYFLLGDNSNVSIDSHNWGASETHEETEDGTPVVGEPRAIPRESLVGRVTQVYLPWDRRREIRRYPLRTVLQ